MSTALIAAWLLPPLAPVLCVLAGLYLLQAKPRMGRALIAGGAGLLLVLSIPVVGSLLMSTLEPPFADPLQDSADAIVVLGGGSYADAPEYGGDTVSSASLERLRYAALLFYKRSHKPILVSGGNPRQYATPESAQMRAVLEDEWRIPVQWREDASDNTRENARNSYAMLERAGIRRIYLVTHAWHMPRARAAFENAGFMVIPAPTRFAMQRNLRVEDFVPDAEGFMLSARFCREVLRSIWYRLRSL
jgi:uncharacterized SAM-binding protein YcdF (DUF218 family)